MLTKPDYAEWEPHKAQIEQIYLHENKTQKELSRIMETTHGFRKTKAQYENAFERWNFKKYKMTPEKWKAVKHRIEKRKRERGKESEVYINGILCPSKKVKYEIGRHAFESTIARLTSGNFPLCKACQRRVAYISLSTFSKNARRCDGLFPWTDYYWPSQWPPNLPWFAFSHTYLSRTLLGNLLPATSSTSQALQTTGLSRSQLKKSLSHSLGSLLSWKTTRSLKLTQSSSRVTAVLNVTMPEEYDGQHRIVSERISSNRELHLEEFMRMALYLLSNNLLGHDPEENVEEKDKIIINLLRISGGLNTSDMRSLVSLKVATADAITEKLFASAVRSGDFQAIETMLQAGMSPDTSVLNGASVTNGGESSSPLVHAARIRDNELSVKITRLLLLHKADLNQKQTGELALECAIERRNEVLLRILISKGAQLPSRALEKAVYSRCSREIVGMILDAGADMEERPRRGVATTVLGYIVLDENAELAQLLLSRGVITDSLHPVDGPDSNAHRRRASRRFSSRVSKCVFGKPSKRYQTTALGLTACNENIQMMKILLAAHATVNRTDNPDNYLHPLVLAVTRRKKEAAKLLLKAGADLQLAESYKTSNGERRKSLFERALEANDLPMCQILLANGAEVGAQFMQDYYSSQLWEHVKHNDTETVALLLQFGARANDLCEGLPNSALGLAITQGNWTMITLLQSAGATGVGHAIPFIASIETARFLERSNLLSQLLWANGQMILIEAILAENEALASLLLSHGADKQVRDTGKTPIISEMRANTPLEAALCRGNLSLAQVIISRGGRVTEVEMNAVMWRAGMIQDHSVLRGFTNMFGPFPFCSPTAIAMAVRSNDEAAIYCLLEAGVDPRGAPKLSIDRDYKELLGPKPAIHTYTYEMMGWWNASHVKRRPRIFHSVLELAVIHGNRLILQALLGSTTWTREEKGRALSISLHLWDRRFMQDLLDVGADIHQDVLLIDQVMKRYSNPVRVALSEGDVHLLRTLLTVDPIVDHINSQVYMAYAIERGNIEQLKILLTAITTINGPLQNSEGKSLLENALYIAGEAGNMELMKILLEAGARIHSVPTPEYHHTTLWHAVEREDLEVVNKVLAAGADVNGPPFEDGGMTPLQQAAKKGNMELVDLFLKAGANVNQEPQPCGGATALQFAAIQGYIGIARKLLDAGASVRAPRAERYGRTAIEGAAEHGRLDMVQLLLNEGVLIDGNDRIEYIRAIKLAQQNCHYAVATLVKSFSDWTEVDSACYEKQVFDREEHRMLDEYEKTKREGRC
ncbi:unnamed protein product [Penicillium egyptiacum]|uniref:Clr5 domain-containing protein n=1 Tax=Penicillium egyptiacum TaxID=1303716 RepID=A0A9W4P970_9EURO|nr:unnamed protein product [Penicillium egyptiacum]